jgi:hypothetical protein
VTEKARNSEEEKTVYTELSMPLLRTLENNSDVKWFNGYNGEWRIRPTQFWPNLRGERLLIFAWGDGRLTWSWMGNFDRMEKYEKLKPPEFIRWCVARFPKRDEV